MTEEMKEFDARDGDVVEQLLGAMIADGLDPDTDYVVINQITYDTEEDQAICQILERGDLRTCLVFITSRAEQQEDGESHQVGLMRLDDFAESAVQKVTIQ